MLLRSIPLGDFQANCYLLTDEKSGESLVIDPGFYCEELEEFMKKNGVSQVKYILLTHGHMDHICGAPYFKEKYGGKIVIGEADAPILEEYHFLDGASSYRDSFRPCIADIIATDDLELYLGDIKITMIATPGHITGEFCYIIEDMIFTGDVLFRESIGRTDLEGGNIFALVKSLKRIRDLNVNFRVFPGHGEETSIAHESEFNRFYKALR